MHRIELGVAGIPISAETASADRHVARLVGDRILIAAIDGLGHGQEALRATVAAMQVLEAATDSAPDALVLQCHEALGSTRGVVMSIATIDTLRRTLTWAGVGNVAGALFQRAAGCCYTGRILLVQAAGVVGHSIPCLQPATVPIAPGDTLVLATNGVHEDFEATVSAGIAVQSLADRILARHAKRVDDALVVVVRLRSGSP